MWRTAFVIVALVAVSAGAASVEKIDLLAIECEVVGIGDEAVTVETDNSRQTIACEDVSEIVLVPDEYAPQSPMSKRGNTVLVTACGDVVSVTLGELDEGVLSFSSPLTGDCRLPMDEIMAIYMPGKNQQPDEIARSCRELGADSGAGDRILVSQDDGNLLPVEGALLTIKNEPGDRRKTQKIITFTWQDVDRQMDAENVRAILLADVDRVETAPAGLIVGKDSSTIGFSSVSLDDQQVKLESPALGTITVAREAIAAIRFFSKRVTYLTDLQPAEVTTYGMVTDSMPHRLGRSVGGGPIVLDGVTYSTGLGLHSFTELTYELDGQFSLFVAIVGIDDSVRPNGDATLEILRKGGDSKEPISLTLTGEDRAATIRCDLVGVTRLTIRAGLGEDELGVADHVDLGGARLIK